MRVAPLPSLRQSQDAVLPVHSPSAHWLGRQSSSLSSSDSDSDESSSRASYYSTLSRNSISTDSKRSAKSQVTAVTPPPRGCFTRCLYRHPRLAFSLVLLLSAIATGAYSAYFFTTLTLQVSGAQTAFALVRTQLVATEITLRRMTECGYSLLTPRVAVLKTHIEMETAPLKAAFAKSTRDLVVGRANFTICREREVVKYKALVEDDDNATKATPEQLGCLVDGIRLTLVRHEASFELSSASTSMEKLKARLEAVMESAKSQKPDADSEPTIREMVSNTTDAGIAVLDQWLNELGETLKSEFDAMAATAILPTRVVTSDQDGVGGYETPPAFVRQRVINELRKAIGRDPKKQRMVDDVDTAWDDTLRIASREKEKSEQYRDDVVRIQNATQEQMQQTEVAIEMAINTLREVVVSQTRSSIEALASGVVKIVVATIQKDLAKLGISLPTRKPSQLAAPDRIPQPTKLWAVGRERLDVHFDSLDRAVHELSHPNQTIPTVTYTPDSRMFRASLLEASSVFMTIVLTYDFLKRGTWVLSKIASLMTESYSDLPPVDIRDIAPITTLIDFWGVLKCRYDFGSVVYTLLTESSYVVQTAVHFVLWVLLEFGGTTVFMSWRRDFARRCRPEPGSPPEEEIEFNFLRVAELLLGQLAKEGLTPLHSVQARSTILYEALEKDAEAWKKLINATSAIHAKEVVDLQLERQFLLDLRTNLQTCSLPVGDSELHSEQCSLSALSRAEEYSLWEKTASVPFHGEGIRTFLSAEPLLAVCLHKNQDETTAVATLARLELARSCLLDQNLYLSLASWWMLFVVGLALRFNSRMMIKSTGMVFWRYLSGDRLDVMAYCDESGVVQSSERLPKAVRRHLRNIRWRVRARMAGVVLSIAWAIAIGCLVLSPEMMRPLV